MAKTTSVFVSGKARTLSNEEFDVKFNKSIEQLEKGLTKGQRSLKLYYDENQRLNDALGRCVEGLSLWQIRLGMWVDETGKARTVAGGFADGLSRTELELGYYADALGEVKSRNDEFVRQTKEAINAEKERAESMQRTREAFADAFDALGDGTGRLASLFAQFDGLSGEAEKTRLRIISFFGSFDAASQTFASLQNLGTWFKEAQTSVLAFNGALATSATKAQGLKTAIAAIGGPWTLVAAGIAATAAALFAFHETSMINNKKVVDEAEKIADSFEKVKRRAKEAGDVIKGISDVLQYGAFYQEDEGLASLEKKMNAAMAKVEHLEAEQKQAQETASEISRAASMGGVGNRVWKEVSRLTRELSTARGELEPLQSKYNEIASELVKQAREELATEEEKAIALKQQYENILKYAETEEDRVVLNKKIAAIEQEIKEASEKSLVDRRNALAKEFGISFDFAPTQTQVSLMADEMEKLRGAFKEDGSGLLKSAEELEEAQKRLAEKYSNASFEDLSKQLLTVNSRASLDEFTAALAAQTESGLLTQERYNELALAVTEKRQELLDAQVAAIPGLKEMLDVQEKSKARADEYAKALGVASQALTNNLLDQESFDKYAEALEEAAKGVKDNVFDKETFNEYAKALGAVAHSLSESLIDQETFNEYKNALDAATKSLVDSESFSEYANALEAAAAAFEQDLVDRETYNDLVNSANEDLAKATEEAAKKMRADVRSELGIDAIMESLKTPAQKFNEQIAKADAALKDQLITAEEHKAFKMKLNQELLARNDDLKGVQDKFKEEKLADAKLDKTAPSKSMEAGSSDLYLALVKNSTATYQTKMQATTEKMCDAQLEALDETRTTNFYLWQMLDKEVLDTIPVYG